MAKCLRVRHLEFHCHAMNINEFLAWTMWHMTMRLSFICVIQMESFIAFGDEEREAMPSKVAQVNYSDQQNISLLVHA